MPTDVSTAIGRNTISRYINSFRIAFSKYLKNGVGMQVSVFPYPSGAVTVMEVGFNLQAKDLFRSDSSSLEGALNRTNIFAELPRRLEFPGTFIILHQNKIVLIKNDDPQEWSQSQVSSDISKICNSIKTQDNG